MRIAVISTLAQGGAAAAAWRITRALTAVGHECTCFALEGGGAPFLFELADTGAPGAPFWTSAAFAHWAALTAREKLAAGGTELFSDHILALHPLSPLPEPLLRADIVHLHWVAGTIFSPALLRALCGKKLVWTLHDMNAFTGGCHYHTECRKFETHCGDCPLLRQSGPDDASARCFALKKSLYRTLAPTIVTPSTWLADEVRSSALLGSFPAVTVQHGFDTEVFRPGDRVAIRRNLGLSQDSFVIALGVEHLDNPRKNTAAAKEALRIVAERNPDAPVEVLSFGHGELADLPFRVLHCGRVEDESVLADIYSAADVYVLPSLMDNLPNTLCEAQCCGTPVLCFDVGGCAETMIPGETGFLVKEKTAVALAAVLEEMLADRERLVPMREAARAFALDRFDPQKVADAYTKIFERALPAPGLGKDSALYADLLQNQIASLAALLRVSQEESVTRMEEHLRQTTALLAEQTALLTEQMAYAQTTQRELEALREKLHHPVRTLFHKLGKKIRASR